MVIFIVLVWYRDLLHERDSYYSARRGVYTEAKMNLDVAKSIIEFVEAQKTGDPYVTPIPRFFTSAFDWFKNSGNLEYLSSKPKEDLIAIYSAIARIEDASDRQEELVIGTAAGSPLAAELRSQNLAFILDATSNIVLTRLEHFSTFSR